MASGSEELGRALLKGGIVDEPKSEEPDSREEETKSEINQEKRELRIDDLNLDIGATYSSDMEENKQGSGEQSKSRNKQAASDSSDDVGEEGSLNSARFSAKLREAKNEPPMAQDFKLLDQLFDFVLGDQ